MASQAQTTQAATGGRFHLAVALGAPPIVEQAFGLHLAGPRVLAEHIIPAITAAAADAGRPAPRVVALVPAAVTTSAEARRTMADGLAFYTQFESYRRVLALNGTEKPVDVALIGDEDAVAEGLRAYAEAGATEIVLTAHHDLDAATQTRTRRLAGLLARA